MKHPKWLLLSWIPVLVALTLISNEALAEHWQWKKLSDSDEAGTTPPARALGSAIYDPLGNRVIVFGGRTGSTYLNDLWAFDLDTLSWVELVAQGTPPTRRRGHNAIYDPMGHRMVSWAGQGSGSGAFFDDVWALDLDSNQWQDVSPVASPPGRYGSTSVFDPVGNRLVSFGGFSDQGRFDDVQAFDLESQTWQNLAPEVGPVKRCLLSSAIDLAARKMIIFGGQSTEQSRRNDLWVFDFATNSWTEAPADAPPSGRFFTTSFVDSGGSFIVFGGSTAAGNSNETWRYDFGGGQWTRLEIPDPPSPRSGMAATLIGEDKLIIFSGSGAGSLEDVWELSRPDQGHLWFAQFGNGMGFSSAIVLTNTSTTEQTEGTVEFSDGVGQGLPVGIVDTENPQPASSAAALPMGITDRVDFSISPLGVVTILTDGEGDLVVGSAQVTATSDLGGVIRFSIPGIGIAGVGSSQPLSGFIAPVRRELGGINTGVAVRNSGDNAVALDLRLRTQAGVEVASAAIDELVANGHFAKFINELFPDADTDDFVGTLVVQASGGEIVATALELGEEPGQFTTLPVTPLE